MMCNLNSHASHSLPLAAELAHSAIAGRSPGTTPARAGALYQAISTGGSGGGRLPRGPAARHSLGHAAERSRGDGRQSSPSPSGRGPGGGKGGNGDDRAEKATPHPASPLQGRGVLIIPSGQAAAAIAPLPVAALRLPEETVELLRSLGIVHVAQLLNLPREDLRARFGQ